MTVLLIVTLGTQEASQLLVPVYMPSTSDNYLIGIAYTNGTGSQLQSVCPDDYVELENSPSLWWCTRILNQRISYKSGVYVSHLN